MRRLRAAARRNRHLRAKLKAAEERAEELADRNWELREARRREPREEPFPRDGEPRNPHAAQRILGMADFCSTRRCSPSRRPTPRR
jgi:hypothetical protein